MVSFFTKVSSLRDCTLTSPLINLGNRVSRNFSRVRIWVWLDNNFTNKDITNIYSNFNFSQSKISSASTLINEKSSISEDVNIPKIPR